MYQQIIYEKDRWVARLTLNRPEKLNAISNIMRSEFDQVLDEVEKDPEVRVLVITGAGRAFSAGYDLGVPIAPGASLDDLIHHDERTEPTTRHDALIKGRDMFVRLWDLRQPVITAVNGYALAAGCNLALIADITIAADNAMFGEPEIREWSLSPVLMLPWVTGYKKAHELMLTGDMVDAQEAYRIGLVNRVVPLAELLDRADRLAWRIAHVGSYNVQAQKRSLKRMYENMGFKESLDYHTTTKFLTYMVPSERRSKLRELRYSQGLKAFLADREAPFKEPW